MRKDLFSINSIRPAFPQGHVVIDYDPEEDVLLISLDASSPEEEEKNSIANSEMLIERARNIVVTINHPRDEPCFISSIALTNASTHPLWADLFRGLEFAMRDGKMMNFSVDPRCWDLR